MLGDFQRVSEGRLPFTASMLERGLNRFLLA